MITAERLREVLSYDAGTGEFTWNISASNVMAGSVAGSVNDRGYRQITIEHGRYYAHRLAWLYMTGEWPKHQIDHINGSKGDNRFSNLREATPSQNHGNTNRPSSNTSGFKGVCFHRGLGRWVAYIRVRKKKMHLGCFDTPEAAHSAYVVAAEKHFGGFARP